MPRGKKAPWSDDRRILQTALELARRPVDSSNTGGYRQAIDTVECTLDALNALYGEEFRRFAQKHFATKPELIEALASLRKLEGQRGQWRAPAGFGSPAALRVRFPKKVAESNFRNPAAPATPPSHAGNGAAAQVLRTGK